MGSSDGSGGGAFGSSPAGLVADAEADAAALPGSPAAEAASRRRTFRRGAGIAILLRLTSVLKAGGHAVDGELDKTTEALYVWIVDR